MSDPPLLEVRNLRTHFRTSAGVVRAVDGVGLTLGRGESLGLVGESGCGKTVTALSIMRLVEYPGEIVGGEILFEGEDLLRRTSAEMRHIRGRSISLVFQDPSTALNPVLRIGDQIKEMYAHHLGIRGKEAEEKAVASLSSVGIREPKAMLRCYPHEFSGGMKQRVVVAIALALQPSLLIADEPTTALDVTIQAQIIALLADLQRQSGTSLMLITHNIGTVAQLCERIAVMYAGSIVEIGPLRTVIRDPKHPYTSALMQAIPSVVKQRGKRLNSIPGVVPDLSDPPSGCRFHTRCGLVMEECGHLRPELREVAPGRHVACHLC